MWRHGGEYDGGHQFSKEATTPSVSTLDDVSKDNYDILGEMVAR